MLQDPKFQNFSRLLTKLPEHTWGLDTKDGLGDYVNWTNAAFHTCLKRRCPNYEAITLSWRRQYAYIPWALEVRAGAWDGRCRVAVGGG